jgi:hypothetical protein
MATEPLLYERAKIETDSLKVLGKRGAGEQLPDPLDLVVQFQIGRMLRGRHQPATQGDRRRAAPCSID